MTPEEHLATAERLMTASGPPEAAELTEWQLKLAELHLMCAQLKAEYDLE